MEERLRFTGANPPPNLWDRYPNWENAIDEEGEPDQDETTLRPSSNQRTIDDHVSFTAGEAVFADGRKVPALLILVSSELGWVDVYPDPSREETWMVCFDSPSSAWIAMNEDWFLNSTNSLRVPVEDDAVFPLNVKSRLPLKSTGNPISVVIAPLA